MKVLKDHGSEQAGFLLNGSNAAEDGIACGLKVKIIAVFNHGPMHEPMPLDLEGVKLRIPRDADQRSELMSITIPK